MSYPGLAEVILQMNTMGMFDIFRHRPVPSAKLARERLLLVLAVVRPLRSPPDYLISVRAELIRVIKKYTGLDDGDDPADHFVNPSTPSPRNTGGASANMKQEQSAH